MRKNILIVAILILSGCAATWSTSKVENRDNPQATSSKGIETSGTKYKTLQDVPLVETDITNHKYTTLGDIEVTVNKMTIFHSDPTREQVNEKLRDEAVKLGADAVIVSYDSEVTGYDGTTTESKVTIGQAIVYENEQD